MTIISFLVNILFIPFVFRNSHPLETSNKKKHLFI